MAVSFTFFTMLITRYPGPTGFSWNFSGSRQRKQTVVCYTAVFSVVTQRALRDDTKNGCVAD